MDQTLSKMRETHRMIMGVLFLLLLLGVSCTIGAWIGSTKDRTAMGALLGVFGFIGWLVIALVPARSNDVAMISQGRPQESLIQNWAAKGAICAGAVGAIVGFVVGLFAHAATAWAAMFEVGIPAFVLGALVGAMSGAVATALCRVRA